MRPTPPRPPAPPKPPADPHTWTCWRDPNHEGITVHPDFGWPSCAECAAAPAYHERPDYLPPGFTLTLYVPAGAPTWCAPASAVVGLRPAGDRTAVYYEGWIHGGRQDQDARERWESGVLQAAGRMITAYPTVARIDAPTTDLHPVGTYNPRTRHIAVTDQARLDAWLATAAPSAP